MFSVNLKHTAPVGALFYFALDGSKQFYVEKFVPSTNGKWYSSLPGYIGEHLGAILTDTEADWVIDFDTEANARVVAYPDIPSSVYREDEAAKAALHDYEKTHHVTVTVSYFTP